MSVESTKTLSYTDVLHRQRNDALRQAEVPLEFAVSLPMPTRRWAGAGYAFFASPAVRRPGQPMEQGAPDRWWVVDARTGRTITYSLSKALPFADGATWEWVTLPPVKRTIDEMRQALKQIEELMNVLAPAFFRGEAGDAGARKELLTALNGQVPEPIQPEYRALAPDFFAWLEA
jgi:hypothetical protein